MFMLIVRYFSTIFGLEEAITLLRPFDMPWCRLNSFKPVMLLFRQLKSSGKVFLMKHDENVVNGAQMKSCRKLTFRRFGRYELIKHEQGR